MAREAYYVAATSRFLAPLGGNLAARTTAEWWQKSFSHQREPLAGPRVAPRTDPCLILRAIAAASTSQAGKLRNPTLNGWSTAVAQKTSLFTRIVTEIVARRNAGVWGTAIHPNLMTRSKGKLVV